MKTAELTGAMLDYWVARASPQCAEITFEMRDDHIAGLTDIEGEKVVCVLLHDGNVLKTMRLRRKYQMDNAIRYSPSTDWAQGGQIIESERICIDAGDGHFEGNKTWEAHLAINAPVRAVDEITGPTPLIAAMRAYVASKFGDEVQEEA
jgi:hypothetical protein